MTSRQQFAPLCDVHHTGMQRKMLEEASEEVRTYHGCERRDCTRVYRDSNGYSDIVGGQFDDSRALRRVCPLCGAVLYLAEVNHSMKIEIWECPCTGCEYSEEYASPSGR